MPSPLRRHRCVDVVASLRCTSCAPIKSASAAPAVARQRPGRCRIAFMCGRRLPAHLDLDAAHLPTYKKRARPGAGIWLQFSCHEDHPCSPNEHIPPYANHSTRDTTIKWAGEALNPPSLSLEHSTIHNAVYCGGVFASQAGGYAAAQPHAKIQQYPRLRGIALAP